jgi:amino acid transporter
LEGVKRLILGSPIPERLAARERLDPVRALATLSSDALSSVAYGTEAALAVLVAAGAAALTANLGIGLVTAALMLIVGYSYRQTIHAYPSGGGSYIVARDNLGTLPGLVAAAALLIDYLLTVSVSVASGIDAIASAFPAIAPAKLGIELGAIALTTLINLRGIRESGTIFAFPTYFFLASFGLMLVVGVVHALTHGGLFAPAPPPVAVPATESLSVLLILTAFASGCSAMTGVEAISNGVPAFTGETPAQQSRNAAQTLVVMVALLATFFLGTTYLAWRVGAISYPSGDPTVTSQIARFAFSGGPLGWLFYVVQTATLLILVFAANTSFADFPRLSAILSRDSFMPALFAFRGERIAFTVGIGTLGIASALVLWIFRGDVVSLINLYALGVFAAFTLSQSGMVVHWLRRRDEPGWRGGLVANGTGAVATGIVTLVIALAKFDRGAWVVVILIPLMVLSFLGIRAFYRRPRMVDLAALTPVTADVVFVPILTHEVIAEVIAEDGPVGRGALRSRGGRAAGATRPEEGLAGVIDQELAYAARIALQVRIVKVVTTQEEADAFCTSWNRHLVTCHPELKSRARMELVLSPYRTVVLPLANFLEWRREEFPGKRVAVLLPREAHPAWWEWPLQRRVAPRVRQELQRRNSPLLLVDLPYTLGRPR